MKTLKQNWLSDFYSIPIPLLLSREDFIAKYMPQYVRDYTAPTGIRLNKLGYPMRSTSGSFKAQVSKREGKIAEAFQAYCQDHAAAVEMDRRATEPTLF